MDGGLTCATSQICPCSRLPQCACCALTLPSDAELAAAYRRFARRPRQRAPRLLVSRWLVAGLVLGLGVAFGAEAVVQRLQPSSLSERPAPAAAPGPGRKAAPLSAPLSSPGQDPPEAAAEPLPSAPELKHGRASGSASPKASGVSADERPPADSAVWAKAAEGLRNNDFAETQAALDTLEQAGSATDREAARLIRAQLMLHQGDVNGARAVLEDLARHAQSAQVRAKARRPAQRSFGEVEFTARGCPERHLTVHASLGGSAIVNRRNGTWGTRLHGTLWVGSRYWRWAAAGGTWCSARRTRGSRAGDLLGGRSSAGPAWEGSLILWGGAAVRTGAGTAWARVIRAAAATTTWGGPISAAAAGVEAITLRPAVAAAGVPAAEVPAAGVPAAEVSAAEVPAAEVPAAELAWVARLNPAGSRTTSTSRPQLVRGARFRS